MGFGRPIFGFGRPIFGFGRPLLVADRGERGSGRHLHPRSGGRGDQGCSEDSWMDRSPSVGVRAAGQVGAVGSLPLSRCATAPPRGERLDRVVRDGTAGWQTWAPGPACCVRRSLPRSLPAPLCLRHLPPPSGGRGEMEITRRSPRAERLDRAVREGTAGWQTWAPGPARCVRRSLPRSVGASLCLRHLPPPSGGRGDPTCSADS